MTFDPSADTAGEVRRLLARRARARGEDMLGVLRRYALERLLFRLSRSSHRERLVLKGAMLFHAWTDQPHRPTRDLDFLGYGEPNIEEFERLFRDLCVVGVEDDGLRFHADTVYGQKMKGTALASGALQGCLERRRSFACGVA